MHHSNIKKFSGSLIIIITLTISILNGLKLVELSENNTIQWNSQYHGLEQIHYIEGLVNENFYRKTEFINVYGWIQDVLRKNEFDNFDVIRDQQGKLHFSFYATQPNDVSEILFEMIDYKAALDSLGVELLFVMAPDKFVRGYTSLDKGLPYNYANETADVFLSELDKRNIHTVDLRLGLADSDLDPADYFFTTDHHWTPEAAFVGFQQVTYALENLLAVTLDPQEIYTNFDQYQMNVYEDFSLGSMGRRTGILYSGVDDFTVIIPTYETSMTYRFDEDGEVKQLEGTFEDALIEKWWSLKTDVPLETRDRYMAYLGGNKKEATIKNEWNPDGLKILMIKDSFMLPLAAFLSTEVAEIKLIDLRYYDEMDMTELAKTYKPDVVIVGVNPTSLVPEFFNFTLK